jgi:hypothetical protein
VPAPDHKSLGLIGSNQLVELGQCARQRAPPEPSTKVSPCHLVRGSSTRLHSESSKPAVSLKPFAVFRLPSSGEVREWYGHDARALSRYAARQQPVAAVPAIVGERAQHAVVVAAQQDAAVADGLGALIGRVAGSAQKPTHVQPPPKKYFCSQMKTARSMHPAGSSIRLSPNGLSASASPAGRTGHAELELTDHIVIRRPRSNWRPLVAGEIRSTHT